MHRRTVLKSIATAATGAGLASVGTGAALAEESRAPAPGPTSFITRDERTRLYYRDWSTGKPVVFIHGWGMNSDMWMYQMVHLVGHGVRCIAYDRRGHGRSSDPGRGFDYDTLADDLAALLEQLELRDVTLIGHSMGGGEIVRYLSRHGAGRVRRVVLVGAALPFLLKTSDNPDGVDKSVYDQLFAAWRKDFPKWLADNAPPFLTPETSAEMTQWVVRMCLQCSLLAAIECDRTVAETDFRPELDKVTVPSLIIHGDRDVSAPLELTGKKTARLIPGSQLKVYEGAPHGLFITHMDRLNGDLLAFIRD